MHVGELFVRLGPNTHRYISQPAYPIDLQYIDHVTKLKDTQNEADIEKFGYNWNHKNNQLLIEWSDTWEPGYLRNPDINDESWIKTQWTFPPHHGLYVLSTNIIGTDPA